MTRIETGEMGLTKISPPTVGDLIHSLDKAAVLGWLASLYSGKGEDPDGYESMWETLKELQPRTTKMSVCISRAWSLDNPPVTLIDVSGVDVGDPAVHWAIEFTDWQEWLSMQVCVSHDLQPMSEDEQLAHCLYEMSWGGYTREEQQKNYSTIMDIAEEVDEILENTIKH